MTQMEPEQFIKAIREADEYNEILYLRGSCYRFHLLLKKFYPQAKCWIDKNRDHVITMIDGLFYDITGEVNILEMEMEYSEFEPIKDCQIPYVESWGFGRHRLMHGKDCPNCGTEILVQTNGELIH